MNVILIEPGEIEGDRATIRGDRARHAREVLRVAKGASIRVGVIDGALGRGEVLAIEADELALRLELGEVPPRSRVDLLLALPRPKALGRLYSPLAQLGVRRLMLTNAERVERSYFDAHQLAPAYARARLLEGLAQARDTRVPEITVHRSLRALLEDDLASLCPGTTRLLADPGAHPSPHAAARARDRVLLAVGPEGGWNVFERDRLGAAEFTPVSLGARPLRSDVAILALLALVHDAIR